MPTVVGTERDLVGAFGASPRSVTITAPGSGNSLGIVLIDSNGRTITNVTCGNGTPTFLYEDPDGYEFWIISGITNSPTSISVEFTGGSSEIYLDKVEFAGGIQQHNAQENSNFAFGSGDLGASLTSTASGVGGFGHFRLGDSQTVTGLAGVTPVPGGTASNKHVLHAADLGSPGTYSFGANNSSAIGRRASGVLIESTGGGGGGVSLAWIRA